MRLPNKTAVVTGSGTGIGKAIAIAMAHNGASVVVGYVGPPEPAAETVSDIERDGGTALAIDADVTNADQVQHMIDQAVQRFGRLDILVNNAGVEEEHPFLDTPLAVYQKIVNVNLTGPWLCSQIAARQMVKQGGGGRIINISSVHEDLPMPTNAPYCASKGGMRMLMRTIAVELAPHGITVNNIGPGAVDTPMNAPLHEHPQLMKKLLSEIPLGRMGRSEEVAELAVFLASESASYITGSTYFIDGGMLRQSGHL